MGPPARNAPYSESHPAPNAPVRMIMSLIGSSAQGFPRKPGT